MTINETIAEVLRFDEEATPGPWNHHHRWGRIFNKSTDPPFSYRRGETEDMDDGAAIVGADNVEVIYEGTFYPYEQTAGVLGAVPADADLIAYYRTAAPALAREVQRLQAEVCEARIGHDCAIMAAYESGLRAGQEAMRVLALAACGAVAAACRQRIEDRYETSAESWEDASAAAAAADCADIIRALEVE